VGKTAIVEGLAKKIVDGDVPEILKDAVVYSLDLGALLAGTKYRGDFEKRFKGLLANSRIVITLFCLSMKCTPLSARAQPPVELWTPVTCSSHCSASGKLRCVGSTTYPGIPRDFRQG